MKAKICDQEVDALIGVQDSQRRSAVLRFQRVVAKFLQNIDYKEANDAFVLHDEHDFVTAGASIPFARE